MATSPTSRSLQVLREEGWLAEKVEHYHHYERKTFDLFGIADIAAARADVPGLLLIQCTSQSNKSSRWQKLISAPASRILLSAGNRIEVWTWGKRGKKGQRKTWQLQRKPVTLADLTLVESEQE